MESIIIIMLSGWIIGIILGVIGVLKAFKDKDKNMFNSSLEIFALFLMTGYITFYPLLLSFLIQYRFKK